MGKAILAVVAAIAAAIPSLWAWKLSNDKKKAAKDLEKRKYDIRKAVTTGDIDAVRRTLAKWL